MSLLLLCVTVLTSLAAAQETPRLGADGRPLLNRPKLDLCRDRKYHEKFGGHHYFLSWREPWNKFEDWDWYVSILFLCSPLLYCIRFNGRNFCRERCMDLVSFESAAEYRHFAKIIYKGR